MYTTRAIYLEDGSVQKLLEQTDHFLNNVAVEGRLKVIKDLRDLLGSVWTRPFSFVEDRESLDAILYILVNKMQVVSQNYVTKLLNQTNREQEEDEILKENVVLQILVQSLKTELDLILKGVR